MTTALVNNNRQPTWQVTPQAGLQVNSVAVSPDGQLTVGGTSSEFGTGQFNFYGFAATGQQLWSVAVTATNVTQGIFWVAVSDDKRFAACGGETSKTCGFLCIVDASNGDILFQDNSLPARVNQLSFTSDGTVLLADFQHELRLYSFAPASAAATPSWAQTDLLALPVDFSSYSAVLAGNGSRAWVAAINYNVKPVYTGIVQQIAVANGKFGAATCYEQTQGVMRIVTTNDGAYAAAALHDGSCAFFQAAQATTAFVYKPDLANLNIAYAVAITQTPAEQLVIVVGANQGEGGVLYRVNAVKSAAGIANFPLWSAQFCWSQSVLYAVNPGVTLDAAATVVTATDGKPDETNGGSNQKESPGHFYLFDANSGEQLWQYQTTVMNWPMMITANGNTAVGGSDDGGIYYWQLTSS